MKFTKLLFIGCILLLVSCKDDEQVIDVVVEEPSIVTDSMIIWKVALDPDTINVVSEDPYYWDGRILTSYQWDEDELVMAFDTSGNVLWRWNDYEPGPGDQRIYNSHFRNGRLLISCGSENYCIDGSSGTTIWSLIKEEPNAYISYSPEENLVFKTYQYGNSPHGDSTIVEMSSLENGVFKEVFKLFKVDDYEVSIPTVSSFLNQAGDTILLFQNRQIIISPYDGKIDFYAYNLSKQEIEWAHYDIGNGESNIRPALIEGDYVYFSGQFDVFCYEKETGELVWQRQLYHDFQGSNFLLYKDLFIVNLDNGDLIAISKLNGETVWVKERLTGCCTELRIFEDKLYLANGDLYIIQADTGDILFEYRTSTRKEKGRGNALFLNAVAVDLEHQRMFTTDGYYLLCLKHPDLE